MTLHLIYVTFQSLHGKVVARAIYDFLAKLELINQPLYAAGNDDSGVNAGQMEALSTTWKSCLPGYSLQHLSAPRQ